MRTVLFALLVLVAACASTSKVIPAHEVTPADHVVPAGPDTYALSGTNESCGNCEPPEVKATRHASAYCANTGKMLDTARQRFDMGIGNHYTLTFACVDKR